MADLLYVGFPVLRIADEIIKPDFIALAANATCSSKLSL